LPLTGASYTLFSL